MKSCSPCVRCEAGMQREAAPKAGAGAASAEELCLQPQDRAMALGAAVPWGQLLPRQQLCLGCHPTAGLTQCFLDMCVPHTDEMQTSI